MDAEGNIASRAQEERLSHLESDTDLNQLEQLLSKFNIFEALGIVRQELRHSDLLAFLLDPTEKHGMGDSFLRKFVEAVLLSALDKGGRIPINLTEWKTWSLKRAKVYRELHYIDVLVIDEDSGLAVIIENKIGAKEHSNQLHTYWNEVAVRFPGCQKVLGLFLTPAGDEASLPAHYLPVSYKLVHDTIEELVAESGATLSPDLLTLLNHYTALLRSNRKPGRQLCRCSGCRSIRVRELMTRYNSRKRKPPSSGPIMWTTCRQMKLLSGIDKLSRKPPGNWCGVTATREAISARRIVKTAYRLGTSKTAQRVKRYTMWRYWGTLMRRAGFMSTLVRRTLSPRRVSAIVLSLDAPW